MLGVVDISYFLPQLIGSGLAFSGTVVGSMVFHSKRMAISKTAYFLRRTHAVHLEQGLIHASLSALYLSSCPSQCVMVIVYLVRSLGYSRIVVVDVLETATIIDVLSDLGRVSCLLQFPSEIFNLCCIDFLAIHLAPTCCSPRFHHR